ncbi:MAG: DUF2283 domain-containing protein [Parcubacteria group bacterium]|nr:DUF2283 domain-containing protein [Parcubacteria group bacterium]
MNIRYSKNEDVLVIKLSDAPYAESDEVREGVIFDYDAKQKIIGIEILDASSRFPRKFQSDMRKSALSPMSFLVESR